MEPLIGSYSNFKLNLIWPNHIYLKWIQHFFEGDLEILKVEDLNHPLLDHLQILNLRLDDHMTMTIFYKSLEWRRSPGGVLRGKLEENPQEILSVAMLSQACFMLFCHIISLFVTYFRGHLPSLNIAGMTVNPNAAGTPSPPGRN